ncbi:MAG: PrsW family glutamic-type intramembrane protease [Bacteroidota bacterium]
MEFLLGLLPVCAFLAALFFLDSYKLIPPRSLLASLGAGCAAAVLAYAVNTMLMEATGIRFELFSRYGAPLTEEALKAIVLVRLLLARKTGFLVDTAIHGFAIGAGFALVENIAYFLTRAPGTIGLWLVRGFGTAMMHGAVGSIAGIIGIVLIERSERPGIAAVLPGIAVAMVIHSGFNHFFLTAVTSTRIIVLALPVLMAVVFWRGERAVRHWTGVGFDTDRELLEMITSGRLGETRIGMFFASIQSGFRGEVLADMLCMLRLHLELAIAAKGLLLMRQSGFEVPPDPEWKEKLAELKYLEHSVGRTGMLAVAPFLNTSRHQLNELLRG